jgi:prepilin-type N-terminal cleavage/methylation domain-containing protein
MSQTRHNRRKGHTRGGAVGFTLAELLVVMAIIAILATVTVVAMRAISADARLSSGVNAVVAALDNARALAMKNNQIVMVAFRPRQQGNEQYVEAVIAKWSGDEFVLRDGSTGGISRLVDRFVPIPDVAARKLPDGVGVASPYYHDTGDLYTLPDFNSDFTWSTQVNLPVGGELPIQGDHLGALIAVMYGPDGTTISRNSATDSNGAFIDFNSDYLMHFRGVDYQSWGLVDPDDKSEPYEQHYEDEETLVTIAPLLAVYDRADAQDRAVGNWASAVGYEELIGSTDVGSDYWRRGIINDTAMRLHFNRYTGVVMR